MKELTQSELDLIMKQSFVFTGLRMGQNLMNAINKYRKDIYDDITMTEFDCFYDENIIDKTIEKLGTYMKNHG